ncbi:S-adenosyl-L-methionine-dependent methyltransferase [Cladochytrium replicatum]|nr:S-adenosyl-L-methionine-dependent methyltransferase [Cladochytrium replicatum]
MGNALSRRNKDRDRQSLDYIYDTNSAAMQKSPYSPPSVLSGTGSGASSNGSVPPPDPLLKYFSPTMLPSITIGTRLSIQQYYLVRWLFKKNFAGISPKFLAGRCKVLEAGSSTGIWLAEMERDFPNGQYYALDLPMTMWPDTQFMNNSRTLNIVESSTLSQLPFPDNYFDYVHEQAQLFITPESIWPPVIAELTRVVKPGGYIDLVELDPHPSTFPTPLISNFLDRHLEKMRADGFFLHGASQVEAILEATGQFADVQVVRHTAPIGWDGQHGMLWRQHMKEGFTIMRPLMGPSTTPDGRMPSESEFDRFLDRFFDDCAIHQCFCNVYRISARKR